MIDCELEQVLGGTIENDENTGAGALFKVRCKDSTCSEGWNYLTLTLYNLTSVCIFCVNHKTELINLIDEYLITNF